MILFWLAIFCFGLVSYLDHRSEHGAIGVMVFGGVLTIYTFIHGLIHGDDDV